MQRYLKRLRERNLPENNVGSHRSPFRLMFGNPVGKVDWFKWEKDLSDHIFNKSGEGINTYFIGAVCKQVKNKSPSNCISRL